jgi:hypothetical protein
MPEPPANKPRYFERWQKGLLPVIAGMLTAAYKIYKTIIFLSGIKSSL